MADLVFIINMFVLIVYCSRDFVNGILCLKPRICRIHQIYSCYIVCDV